MQERKPEIRHQGLLTRLGAGLEAFAESDWGQAFGQVSNLNPFATKVESSFSPRQPTVKSIGKQHNPPNT